MGYFFIFATYLQGLSAVMISYNFYNSIKNYDDLKEESINDNFIYEK